MPRSFYAGLIIKQVNCQGLETCDRGRNYFSYLASVCLWALLKHLQKMQIFHQKRQYLHCYNK
jgi:hypothetical protein